MVEENMCGSSDQSGQISHVLHCVDPSRWPSSFHSNAVTGQYKSPSIAPCCTAQLMSSMQTMFTILQDLNNEFPGKFDEFSTANVTNLGRSTAYQGTVLGFNHSNHAKLLVDMNKALLNPYLVPSLSKDPSEFMELHFCNSVLELRCSASWARFEVTPAEYAANRYEYFLFMSFVLDAYLVENGLNISFEDMLNSK
jgi:hypothetical protein